MAYGELFRQFSIRFSMKKRQHVQLLKKFEDNKLNGGKSKNQVVMDALEMYYNALEAGNGNEDGLPEEVTPAYLEMRLSDMKEQIKRELLQEIIHIVLGNAVAGQAAPAPLPGGEMETGDMEEDGVADISGMPDIMDKVMGWSENS